MPVGLSSHQTAQRRLSGAHNDRSQSHRQWLAVTAPAGRAHAVERVEATCRREPRCCQTKQVPKKGVEGRRRDARRRPKKLRFISRGKKALAHPSLLPLNQPYLQLCTHEAHRWESESGRAGGVGAQQLVVRGQLHSPMVKLVMRVAHVAPIRARCFNSKRTSFHVALELEHVESVDLRSAIRKADAVLPAFARAGQRGDTLKRVARRGRCRLLFRLGVQHNPYLLI